MKKDKILYCILKQFKNFNYKMNHPIAHISYKYLLMNVKVNPLLEKGINSR